MVAQKFYFWYNMRIMEQFNVFFTNGLGISPFLMGVMAVWVIFWKGCSLWIAARNNKKWWFVALLILNTLGILERLPSSWLSRNNGYSRKIRGEILG